MTWDVADSENRHETLETPIHGPRGRFYSSISPPFPTTFLPRIKSHYNKNWDKKQLILVEGYDNTVTTTIIGALDGGSPKSLVDFKNWQCPLSLYFKLSCPF